MPSGGAQSHSQSGSGRSREAAGKAALARDGRGLDCVRAAHEPVSAPNRYIAASLRPETPLTVLDDVRNLIARLAPDPVCDDCIADRLGLSVRQHANHKTRELAGTGGFERRKGICSLCGAEKKVIRRA